MTLPSESTNVKLHPSTAVLVDADLRATRHGTNRNVSLFLPVKNNVRGNGQALITPDGVYKMMMGDAKADKIDVGGFESHALRATATTNAPGHDADIAKVPGWLGHANIATTRIYDQRKILAGI